MTIPSEIRAYLAGHPEGATGETVAKGVHRRSGDVLQVLRSDPSFSVRVERAESGRDRLLYLLAPVPAECPGSVRKGNDAPESQCARMLRLLKVRPHTSMELAIEHGIGRPNSRRAELNERLLRERIVCERVPGAHDAAHYVYRLIPAEQVAA